MARTPEEFRAYKRENKREWRKKNPVRSRELSREAGRRWRATDAARQYRRRQAGLPEPTRPMPAVCELCGGPPGARSLHLDHDHITGDFRGWLCGGCNMGIGLLGDDVAGLERAIVYLALA